MKKVFLLSLLCLFALSLSASDWKAWWISSDQCRNEPNTWLCYRKTTDISALPEQAIARIAADSKYWLWINDSLVVFEGGLKRGPNPKDSYYDEVDIAPFLQKGKNTIAVLVWYFGKQGFSHHSSGKAGLLFDCQAPGLEIISDDSWQCFIHPAYQTCPEPVPNFRLSESSILYDARKDIGNWYSSKQQVPMATATKLQKAGGSPWNELIKRPIPLWKDSGLKEYRKTYRNGDTLICELPYNSQITPYLRIKSKAGLKITLATDNYFYYNGATENLRAEYITKDGEQEYESPGWMNGHKMYYLIPSDVEIKKVLYRETGYDTSFSGSFNSSDSWLNALWKKSQRTLYVTMRDTYMDCPERERAQWTGDAVNQSGESFYSLSPSSHQLVKKWLSELINWQKTDGSIYAPVPAGNWEKELPGQTLASIGYFGAYNYYMHIGDTATIAAIYPAIKKYLNLWKVGADGLILLREGGWLWGDWGNHRDMLPLMNAWYYLALKGMNFIATDLGYTADATNYSTQLRNLQVAFNTRFWNGTAYRDPKYKGETDDRVQALAVVAGLASPSQYPALLKVLQQEYHSSPYMEKYVFEAMMMMGKEEEAISRHKERMNDMVTDSCFTTLWEHWDVKSSGYRSGTINHSWTGGGLTILSQYVCGIAPLAPGYDKISIMPQPGSIANAIAEVASVKGKIKSSFSQTDKSLTMDVETPAGIKSVTVGVPAKDVKKIKISGKKVWAKGKFISNSIALPAEMNKESHILFNLSGGNYHIYVSK